jgi:hypothetical protein
MNEYIWLVTVTDEVLIFDKVPKPFDWKEKAVEQPYGELNGTYLGARGYESDHWYLRRDKKMPKNSGLSYRQWRLSQINESMEGWNQNHRYPYSHGYAWQPSYYFKYDDKLYILGAGAL